MTRTMFRTKTVVLVGLFMALVAPSLISLAQAPEPLKPGPEMEKLRFLVGDWTYEEKYEASPFGPAGTGKGTMQCRLGPGGFSIVVDFRTNTATGESVGHEIQTWDPAAKKYTFYAVGNEFPGAIVSTGNWEGNALVMNGTLAAGENKFRFRTRLTRSGSNAAQYTVESATGDEPLKLVVTGRATKK